MVKIITLPDNRPNVTLCVKFNNFTTNEPCPLCGEPTYPDCGPELFLEGTYRPVCYQCGKKYAPELVLMLKYLQGIDDQMRYWDHQRAHEEWMQEEAQRLTAVGIYRAKPE